MKQVCEKQPDCSILAMSVLRYLLENLMEILSRSWIYKSLFQKKTKARELILGIVTNRWDLKYWV